MVGCISLVYHRDTVVMFFWVCSESQLLVLPFSASTALMRLYMRLLVMKVIVQHQLIGKIRNSLGVPNFNIRAFITIN